MSLKMTGTSVCLYVLKEILLVVILTIAFLVFLLSAQSLLELMQYITE
jgi:hypothetical protein